MTARALLAIALTAACAAACSNDEPPAKDLTKPKHATVPQLQAAEIQRSRDACAAYVDHVCACNAPAAKQQCTLAKGLPPALELALSLMASPDALPKDALAAETNVRETVKQCIEQTAKLPAIGCP